jgi:two-component system, chemotaxis family, response regulator PixH
MGQKALVADDDPLMRRLCVGILELAGYQVIKANNGREAVQLATRELPQLIIMDVVMSEMSGLEALRQLKHAEATRPIPVIMITGEPNSQTQVESASSGAAAFLAKPFRAAELLQTIQRLTLLPVANEKSE